MASTTKAIGVSSATSKLENIVVTRRAPREDDVDIKVMYAGICHSDLSQARGEWGPSPNFPMVPGHEIVGKVLAVGSKVTKFKVGDSVGVGCMVDSCQSCSSCSAGDEQYCLKDRVWTYNDKMRFVDDELCAGGYSGRIVVKESFVLSIPANLDLAGAAPLLCAGITTYSPLIHFGLKPNHKLAVVGLGGLGHMAVKLGLKFGAHVTVFSRGTAKKEGAMALGANDYVDSSNPEEMARVANTFNLLVDTVGVQHDIGLYLPSLCLDGKLIMVGVCASVTVAPFALISARRSIAGSLIGGVQETQEMLDFCGRHNIVADIEMVNADAKDVEEAWDRAHAGKVHYRFVIDMTKME